jgi:2-(3-amino-3-carboxypropyl)histidine synthase
MKTLFIEAKSDIKVKLEREVIKKLPKRVGLVSTIQHLHALKSIKKQLKNSVIGGQVLGCDVGAARRIRDKVDAFLYIGTGEFHPLGIALETGKEVYSYNPITKRMGKISKGDVEAYKRRRKGAYMKFLSSKRIGILVSTKPGQNNLRKAFELKRKLKDKECYIFVADTLHINQLENFPFVECWVNTACPRIVDDSSPKRIINFDDVC